MNQKRTRSLNWEEEEKQLLRSVLKEFVKDIENKSLNTDTRKIKSKAWEKVYERFNELNSRHRELSQLKIQWKAMKINARKTYSSFKEEITKTGGGARPVTPNEAVIEIKDLLNPGELLRDHNIYDSDGIIPSSSANKVVLANPGETCIITLQDLNPMTCAIKASDTCVNNNIITNQENQQTANSKPVTCVVKALDTCVNNNIITNQENQQTANISIETIEDIDAQVDAQELTPLVISQDNITTATSIKKNMGTTSAKKVPKRKLLSNNISENGLKSRKDHADYVSSMISHSKMLKEEEHRRQMEMAEEEHAIKMAIHKENLKCAILEREILELKKVHGEKS